MKSGAGYYAGGVRIIIDDIPIRMARPTSKDNLANLRWHKSGVKFPSILVLMIGHSDEQRKRKRKFSFMPICSEFPYRRQKPGSNVNDCI